MTENAGELRESTPSPTEDLEAVQQENTKTSSAPEITIPVKFNKEIKNLTVDEAGELAQKGMKFDMISSDYERIKTLAKGNGIGVSDYLCALEREQTNDRKKSLTERCNGDEELALHIMQLEEAVFEQSNNDFLELKEKFPEIKNVSDLPQEVLEKAQTKGTNLLDEFLRYRLEVELEQKEISNIQNRALVSSVGSQSASPKTSNLTDQFLRGLWG